MITCTSITLTSLFLSRKNLSQDGTQRRRDVRFAITCITLDISFILLNLPNALGSVIGDYFYEGNPAMQGFLYVVTVLFYYLDNGILFYLSLAFNRLFRSEFKALVSEVSGKMMGRPIQESQAHSTIVPQS